MKKLLAYCFDRAKLSILFFVITLSILFIGTYLELMLLVDITFFVLPLAFLALIASIIYQFVKKRWLKGFITLLIAVAGCITYYCFVLMPLVYVASGDSFADDIVIPANVHYYTPSNNLGEQAIKTNNDLEIYGGSGTYSYCIWYGKIESGKAYIKAYEITRNIALSVDRLRGSSSLYISNNRDTLKKFSSQSPFTIYEGDQDKPYLARFELWFKPLGEGKERKLMEKVYRIEGWQK